MSGESPVLRMIAIVLWVFVFFGGIYLVLNRKPQMPGEVRINQNSPVQEISWNRLPTIDPFELTTSTGEKFDSATLAGRPYAVSFFYSTCPDVCRRLNDQVQRLTKEFKSDDLMFLSITVDPETDTPQRLAQYAEVYDQDPSRWKFLTGNFSEIQQVGNQSFRVVIDKAVHTEDILLVDRWGRFRDRFKWDNPQDMKRFARVAQEVIDEQVPPLGKQVTTRNLVAGNPHRAGNIPRWLNDFFLTRSDGTEFYSRDLTGSVWIGSVFFSNCATHCIEQNRYLRDLQDRLPADVQLVSISTDAVNDTPSRLSQYAKDLNAQPDRWYFLTSSDQNYLERVANEFLGLFVRGTDHATDLVVVDRWGVVRGKFDWRDPQAEAAMMALIEKLRQETKPPPAAADPPSSNRVSLKGSATK